MTINLYSGPRPTRLPLQPGTVYSFFDADDRCLYVGCTGPQYAARFAGHGGKAWWTQVCRIEVEHFECKGDALSHERHLIRKLRPQHNIAQHPDRDPHILDARRRHAVIDRFYRGTEGTAA